MTTYAVNNPFEVFADINGEPLEAGYIYIGEVNKNPITNPIAVFWDSYLTYPAAQPIRTLAGYPSRNGSAANIFTNQHYSISVYDKNKSLIFNQLIANIDPFFNSGISITSFGAVGDGTTDDTNAFQTAIDYVNNEYNTVSVRPSIILPAGIYLVGNIEMNSMRGIHFIGEGSIDPVKQKTVWLYGGANGQDSILKMIGCGGMLFEGITFNLNSAESMTSMITFELNPPGTLPPLTTFGTNFCTFKRCVFLVQASITTKPDQTLWIKNCSNVLIDECHIKASNENAVRIGEAAVTPVSSDGIALNTRIINSYILGNIDRQYSRNLEIKNCQFYSRTDDVTKISIISTSGAENTINENIEGNIWDPAGISDYSGDPLISGGDDAALPYGNLRVVGNQLTGRTVLVEAHQGSVEVSQNRPIGIGTSNQNRLLRVQSGVKEVKMFGNYIDQYVGLNSVGNVLSQMFQDFRGRPRPYLTIASVGGSVTLPAAAVFTPVISVTEKFPGGYLRIKYNIGIQNKDTASNVIVYGARVQLDSTTLDITGRRITLQELDSIGYLVCDAVVYVGASEQVQTLAVYVNQANGPGPYGVTLASGLNNSNWSVEMLQT